MTARNAIFAAAMAAGVFALAKPAVSTEKFPVTALTIEKSIPFEVTQSHLWNYDTGVAFGFGSLWTVVHPNLVRVDPTTNDRTTIEMKIAGPTRFLAFGEDGVWVADTGTNTVHKVDAATNKIAFSVKAPMLSRTSPLGLGDGSVWIVTAESAERTLTRLNAKTGEKQATITLPTTSSGGAVFDFGSVWVVGTGGDEVYRIDPKTNAIVQTIKTCTEPTFPATGEGSIWVNCRKAGVVSRIDGGTGAVTANIETGSSGHEEMTVGGGYVWLATLPIALIQIDPRDNTVFRTFTGRDLHVLNNVAYGDGSVWMLRVAPTGEIYRLRTPE